MTQVDKELIVVCDFAILFTCFFVYVEIKKILTYMKKIGRM